MFKKILMLITTLILAFSAMPSFAISPGAGQAQIQNNAQAIKQHQETMKQMRQQHKQQMMEKKQQRMQQKQEMMQKKQQQMQQKQEMMKNHMQ